MTAQVLPAFTHHHNALKMACQELDLAGQDYEDACLKFSSLDPQKTAKWNAALERKHRAWDFYWQIKRAY